MGEAFDKLIKALDQFLPFLESAPPWLRIWVYLLIGLNFVTIAAVSVSYLIHKQSVAESQTFEHFSIDSPTANELIPLGDSGRWMVAGRFPVIPAGTAAKHDVQVDILRLPDRDKIAQEGGARISTAAGAWRFESAKFPGAGSYEIVATATVDSATDFRSVAVSCTDKASAYRDSIVRDREQRGAPPIIWPDPQTLSLPRIEQQFGVLQNQFYRQFFAEKDRDLAGSLETVNLALNLVEPALPSFPNNYDLQNFRAYMLKNYAMIMSDMGRADDAARSLDEAAKMFTAIHEQKPDDPSAWNGLGSVAILRNQPQLALQYIDQALLLQSNYPEALHDREVALAMLRQGAASR